VKLNQAQPTWFFVVNGVLEGDVYVPNAQSAQDIEIEVEELSGHREEQILEFKSANLLVASTRLNTIYHLSSLDGPGGSKWSLDSAYAQGKGKGKNGAVLGWMYVDLTCALDKTSEDIAVGMGPLVGCRILAPSASELGVGRFDGKLTVNNERGKESSRNMVHDGSVLAGPATSAKHAAGSLLLKVSVERLSRVSNKKMLLPVDTKKVVEPKSMIPTAS
jgi:hypothetical protein